MFPKVTINRILELRKLSMYVKQSFTARNQFRGCLPPFLCLYSLYVLFGAEDILLLYVLEVTFGSSYDKTEINGKQKYAGVDKQCQSVQNNSESTIR
jgi:hypothetical protein